MPWIERVRTEQPLDAGVGVDWGNPITRGLRVILNGADNQVAPWTIIGGASRSLDQTGISRLVNGSNQALSTPLDLTNTKAVTVVSLMTPVGYSSPYNMFWEFTADGNSVNGGFALYSNNSSARIDIGCNGGGTDSANYSPRFATGVPVSLAATYDHTKPNGQQIGLFTNGVPAAVTVSGSLGGSGSFGNSTLYLGARTASTLWAYNKYTFFVLFDCRKTDAEIKSLYDNPWQLFEKERVWVPVAAGGDTYTLTADSGSFALTGQDTALNFNRTLAADSGSFALTGQAAALTFNRALVADSGSFALAGQDATPTFSRVLSAASGSYALAGQDATLTYTPISGATYTLAAASGSFALAGQGAVLLQNRSLAADSGSFALTGQDATLARGYMMPAQSGDYSVAGQDAALIASRRLAADSEAFALTGQNADLTYTPITGNTYTLSASSGSFVLTGQDAQLLQNRALAADTATYALAGQGAALTYSGSVSAIYPSPSVVLFGVSYGPTGVEYTGTFAVPSAASIAAQVRTELAAELLRITEVAKIHGLVQGVNLVVTPTSRTAGDIAQTISGDGVSSSIVSRV